MNHSTPKLSEITRHLVIPSGIVSSGWPSVGSALTRLGVVFDPWQQQGTRLALAKRADGLYAAGIGGVGWSVPRQAGKTFTIGSLVFALALLEPGLTVIWTAHQLRTSNETFQAMQAFANRPRVKPHIGRIRTANGEGVIPFRNGSRVLFGARERGFGLGFAKVGVLIFDEAQRATNKAFEDMVPSTNQAPNPLIFVIGTPPRPTDPGEVFTLRRSKALAGGDDSVWMEFGADTGCDPRGWAEGWVDWEQVAKANPSFPHRTPKAAILRMLANLGADSFAREGLGLWDVDSPGEQPVIDPGLWQQSAAVAPKPGAEDRVCFGVRFALDGSAALAGAVNTGKTIHVEVIDSRPVEAGVSWLVDYLLPRWEDAAQIVIDGKSGSGALIAHLHQLGVGRKTLLTPKVDEVITAHSMFLQRLGDSSLTHGPQPGLDDQVRRAGRRPIGQAGGWGWKSLTGEPVTGLEAATLAVWAAATTKRRPGRSGGAVL